MRRSTTPQAILTLGLMCVVCFGGVVWWLSGASPIIKLRPELERHYGVRGFKCWLKVKEGKVEVEPPPALALDRAGRRKLGAVTLSRYLELTKGQTVVDTVVVLPARVEGDASPAPVEEVSRAAADAATMVEGMARAIADGASIAAGTTASVTMVAPSESGALVVLSLSGDENAARRAASAVLQTPMVEAVRVERGTGPAFETTRGKR